MTGGTAMCSVAIITILCISLRAATADDESFTPTIILAHPAAFGRRWSEVVTVALQTANVDLCDGTKIENENANIAFDNSIELYDTAVFFDDPNARIREEGCDYAQIAQAVEKMYPMAQYLLVSSDGLYAMGKSEDAPDTKLALASITLEDVEVLKYKIRGENITSLGNPGETIVFEIDAVSRSILDICTCNSSLAKKDTSDDKHLSVNLKQCGCEILNSEDQHIKMSRLLRVGGALSFLGSGYVLLSLIGSKRRRSRSLQLLFNRLLLCISIADMCSSLGMVVGNLAFPSTPPGDFAGYHSQNLWDSRFPDGRGNSATCTAQGFFIHIGIGGSTFFTGFVAIQAVLMVRYGWTDQQMRKAEIAFFILGIGYPLATAISAAVFDMFHPIGLGFCWISNSPPDCWWRLSGPILDEYCDAVGNGTDTFFYQIGFALAWVALMLLVIMGSMLSLFLFVRKRELQVARWHHNHRRRSQQQKVFFKAIMHLSAYAIVWIPTAVAQTGGAAFDGELVNIMVALALPLQGSLNALIYSGIIEKCLPRICCCFEKEGSSTLTSSSSGNFFALFSMGSNRDVSVKRQSEHGSEVGSARDKMAPSSPAVFSSALSLKSEKDPVSEVASC